MNTTPADNLATTVIMRDHGRITMRFDGLSTADADWYVRTIRNVPGRAVNRIERLAS